MNRILQKAELGMGLNKNEVEELCKWLNVVNKEKLNEVIRIAEKVRLQHFGKTTSFYTCLYISNECINNCPYCGFRSSNKAITRLTLTLDQIATEVDAISELGIKNIILIAGTVLESKYKKIILDSTKLIIQKGLNPWIEFENLSLSTMQELISIGAKRFILFQETYNDFKTIHNKNGFKNDPGRRMLMVEQAVVAGFKEIGIGALFGLKKNSFIEVMGLYSHAKSLMNEGIKVLISFPRMTPAPGVVADTPPHRPDYLEKAIIILRLALPNVSLALSGREQPDFRNGLFGIVDEVGSGGATNPGGRTIYKNYYKKGDKQFSLFDKRTPREILKEINNKTIK